MLIGKLIDQQKIIATKVNLKDTLINFYYLDNRSWKQVGSEKTNTLAFTVGFEDRDGDNKNEIITSSFYENPGNELNGLTLKFKQRYQENNKKQQRFWDNFFSK